MSTAKENLGHCQYQENQINYLNSVKNKQVTQIFEKGSQVHYSAQLVLTYKLFIRSSCELQVPQITVN